jgi:hypothetical protein
VPARRHIVLFRSLRIRSTRDRRHRTDYGVTVRGCPFRVDRLAGVDTVRGRRLQPEVVHTRGDAARPAHRSRARAVRACDRVGSMGTNGHKRRNPRPRGCRRVSAERRKPRAGRLSSGGACRDRTRRPPACKMGAEARNRSTTGNHGPESAPLRAVGSPRVAPVRHHEATTGRHLFSWPQTRAHACHPPRDGSTRANHPDSNPRSTRWLVHRRDTG